MPSELLETFREYEEENNTESLTDMLEGYIKGVQLQKRSIPRSASSTTRTVPTRPRRCSPEYAGWLSSFTAPHHGVRGRGENLPGALRGQPPPRSREPRKPPAAGVPLLHPYLDALNGGRNLRGQLTCFLASTGVGEIEQQQGIGIRADIDDGLHVLHYQLEGSEQEALDAYSGGMISRNAYYFEQGKISDREFKHFEELVMSYAGSITVRSFPRFAARISTMDIKNGVNRIPQINGYSPDVVIDGLGLLTNATRRQWGAEHERSKRIAVANDLKDLAADENV